VTDICTRLQSAYRTVRLYPPGHVMIEGRLEPLEAALGAFLATHDSLALRVEESSLTYDGELVFRQEEMRDEMAFIMFREGIRLLSFFSGLEAEEIRGLVDCLSRAPEAEALDQDLVTLLWESDFTHLEYDVVDPLLVELSGADSLEALKADARARLEEGEAADFSLTTEGWDASERLDTAVLDIEEGILVGAEELAEVEKALNEEPRPLQQLVEVLLEMLVCANSDHTVGAVRTTLAEILVSELQSGAVGLVLPIVVQLRGLEGLYHERIPVFRSILADLARADALRPALAGLDGALTDSQPVVEQLLPHLAPFSHPALLDLLAEASGRRERKCLLNVLGSDRLLPLAEVKDRMADPRWFVVRNLVVLLGLSDGRCPPDYLLPVLHHTDERVRLEAVRSLAALSSFRAAILLTSALTDQSSPVRVAAAQAVGRRRHQDALPALMAAVNSPAFPSRPPDEVTAFLTAAAAIGGDTVLPAILRLSEDRLLRPMPAPVRLAALRVAADIGTPAARSGLERARRSRNREVREEATRCLLRCGVAPRPPATPGLAGGL
jgi:hypothetical protein